MFFIYLNLYRYVVSNHVNKERFCKRCNDYLCDTCLQNQTCTKCYSNSYNLKNGNCYYKSIQIKKKCNEDEYKFSSYYCLKKCVNGTVTNNKKCDCMPGCNYCYYNYQEKEAFCQRCKDMKKWLYRGNCIDNCDKIKDIRVYNYRYSNGKRYTITYKFCRDKCTNFFKNNNYLV